MIRFAELIGGGKVKADTKGFAKDAPAGERKHSCVIEKYQI